MIKKTLVGLTLEEARPWYAHPGDAAHDFGHIERVYGMARRLAAAENADEEIVLTAALFHDVQEGLPGSAKRATHHHYAADFAAQHLAEQGWSAERIQAVQHCIRAHRFRGDGEAPSTLEAKVLFDADKLDVLGALGAVRTIAYAIQAGNPAFAEPSARFLKSGEKEPGEPHSAYHEFHYKLVKIKDRLYTNSGRALAEERHTWLVNFFNELAAEMRGER